MLFFFLLIPFSLNAFDDMSKGRGKGTPNPPGPPPPPRFTNEHLYQGDNAETIVCQIAIIGNQDIEKLPN